MKLKYITCRTIHDTGEVFFDAKNIKDNEVYAIVEAKNIEHAKDLMKAQCKCPVCNHYTLRLEEIIVSDTGQKVGETIVCDNCIAEQLEAGYEE